jgi:hypothetical protein
MNQSPNPADIQLLKRCGLRPLAFQGDFLVHASSANVMTDLNVALWHEIAVYEKQDGGFVAHLIFRQSESVMSERHRAMPCATIDEVYDFFRQYQPESDVACASPGLDDTGDATGLDAQIAELEQCMSTARISYSQALSLAFGARDPLHHTTLQ